jgi:predicted ribosome quality control (RQC) complex YloA/Tae2 family protein
VRIAVQRAGEERILWLRLWTSAANAIVTDGEGTILDAMYRRPAKGEVSGGTFDPAQAAARAAGRPRRDYAVRDLPGEGSFNARVEAHFARLENEGRRGQLAEQAEAALAARENGVLAALKQLEDRRASYAEPERLRELGDLITSNLHRAVRGQRLLEVEDFFRGGARLAIEMDPLLGPAQNAQKYYERAHKAKHGLGKVLEEIESLHGMLEAIRGQRESLAAAADTESLAGIAGRAAQDRTPRVDPGTPGLVFWSGPFKCLVGRTGAENDELLRRWVRGSDWWFHARDWPGAYVFVKTPQGKSLPLQTMLDAGSLAIHFSRGKASAGGEVYYTQVKYLRRAKGAKRGTVLPTQEKNLSIRLEPGRIERLKQAAAAPRG